MQCKEISSLVMKYFDGNISELEREMIIKHNDKCSGCAEEFRVLREAIGTLEEFLEIEVPIGFESRVMEGIKTQRMYFTNPKIVAFWLISVLGLIVFAWNMLTFVTIPFVRESGVLIAAQNVLIYGVNIISGILREVLVTISVLLGKILVLRNVLLRDYVTFVTTIVMAFMGINLILIFRLNLREN
ncbi:MAG TPA: zf-HC2 domain-containing protein [Clostridia bacterium]|nr:zf-HC2 domain-containing protein [Clostridia bacterium]